MRISSRPKAFARRVSAGPSPVALFVGSLSLLAASGCAFEAPDSEADVESVESVAQELGCFQSLVPTMTSNTAPSGIVTRSGAFSSTYEAWKAFDATTSTMWISQVKQTPAWIGYEWTDAPRIVSKYALHFVNGSLTSRAPKNWTFEGFDGTTWIALDTRTNQVNWAGSERREYTVTNPGSYRKYRLSVTDDNDTRTGVEVVSLGRLELVGCDPTTAPLWTRFFGAPGSFTQGTDMTGDPAARTYETGMTNAGTFDGNARVGLMDAFVRATDWNGGKMWTQQIGAPDSVTVGYGVARNSRWEEIYATGLTSGGLHGNALIGGEDAFLTKIRYTGVRGWTRQLGVAGASTEGYGVAVDASDNAFMVGTTEGPLDGNTRVGSIDAFVAKYDALGNKLWTRQFGSPGAVTHARRAITDASGNVYVAGWTTGALHGGTRVGQQDFFVVKFDAAGVRQWTRQHGAATSTTWLYGGAHDAGRVYLTGYTNGNLDGVSTGSNTRAYLVQYDEAGNRLWTRQFGSGSGAWGWSIFANSWWAPGIYVAGSGIGNVENPSDLSGSVSHTFVAKFDTSGTREWIYQNNPARRGGTDQSVQTTGVVLDQDENLYVGGYSYGDLGGVTLQGNPDAFVQKIARPE